LSSRNARLSQHREGKEKTMKRLISIAVATALVVGSAGEALAKPHKKKAPVRRTHVAQPYYGQYGQQYYRRPANNNNGAAIALGMLAIGTIAAIAASKNGSASIGYSHGYPPAPYGAYGGGYGGYPVGYAAAPPPPAPVVREYEREKVVEYRRDYEHVREVAAPPPVPYGYGGGYYGY
jgi:hypothetical protein